MGDLYDPGAVDAEDHAPFLTRGVPSDVLPPTLLGLLITTRVWPAERVFADIELLGVPSDREHALVAVAPHLPARTLELVHTIRSDRARRRPRRDRPAPAR